MAMGSRLSISFESYLVAFIDLKRLDSTNMPIEVKYPRRNEIPRNGSKSVTIPNSHWQYRDGLDGSTVSFWQEQLFSVKEWISGRWRTEHTVKPYCSDPGNSTGHQRGIFTLHQRNLSIDLKWDWIDLKSLFSSHMVPYDNILKGFWNRSHELWEFLYTTACRSRDSF